MSDVITNVAGESPRPPHRAPFDREDMHDLLKTMSTESLIECAQIIGRKPPYTRSGLIIGLLNYMDDPVDLLPRPDRGAGEEGYE